MMKFSKNFVMKFPTTTYPKKCRLGPQNGFGSSGPKKLLKIVNYEKLSESCFELVGKDGWPPISTWINSYVLVC
jgi:hypothetical protein